MKLGFIYLWLWWSCAKTYLILYIAQDPRKAIRKDKIDIKRSYFYCPQTERERKGNQDCERTYNACDWEINTQNRTRIYKSVTKRKLRNKHTSGKGLKQPVIMCTGSLSIRKRNIYENHHMNFYIPRAQLKFKREITWNMRHSSQTARNSHWKN